MRNTKDIVPNVSRNIRQIRELKNFTQEYMANELGITQPAYAKIEKGLTTPKIDRLQEISDILEVDLSALLSTTNIFHVVFNAAANQSGYINTQNITGIDIETIRKIIQEELEKNK